MIINLNDIDRLQNFILNEATDEELVICDNCCNVKKYTKCKDKDICQKYTPIIGNGAKKLIEDLFDTIEYLRKE